MSDKQPLTEHEWTWRGYRYRTCGATMEATRDGIEWIFSSNIYAAVSAIRELAIKLAEKEEGR